MSLCRTSCSVLFSRGRTACITRLLSNFHGMKVSQQTTRYSGRRILQTCKPVATRYSLITSCNRSYCIKQEESANHINGSDEVDEIQEKKLLVFEQKLRSWSFQVDLFGKIVIRSPFNAILKPVSPLEHPAGDKAFITLTLKSTNEIDESLFEMVSKSLQAVADYKDNEIHVEGNFLENVNAELEEQGASVLWQAEVPISFDADIQTTDHGDIVLEKLENKMCVIESDRGNCHLNKIKSGYVKVTTSSGHFISKKVLQGNAVITTQGLGSITTDRLQGQTFVLSSEAGSISCKDLYAVQAGVKTTSGHVDIVNAHGQCDIITDKGNVDIGSLDGSLNAVTESGNISSYLVRHKEVTVASQKGNLSLKVPSDVKSAVHLEGPSISVEEELHTPSVVKDQSSDGAVFSGIWNGDEENKLTAVTAQGSITVEVQSWFDSLKLTKGN